MAIPLPDLDTRSYQELVDEAQALIPNLFPEWTNHNPTDPGIVLIELLAWLTEMLLYRTDQIPEENYLTFLKLLNEPGWSFDGNVHPDAVRREIQQTVGRLRERYRAATVEDFEVLALESWRHTPEAQSLGTAGMIRRARCLSQTGVDASGKLQPVMPGHVTVILVPEAEENDIRPQPSPALQAALWRFFDERRLLTTRHHVVGPTYVGVLVKATLHLRDDASGSEVRRAALNRLQTFFHPLRGGPDGQGWPFGRDIHLSEIFEQLDQVPGVDFVKKVRLQAPDSPDREHRSGTGESVDSLIVNNHELVTLVSQRKDFLTMEREGETWRRTSG